ncbi:VirB3 family type IV secretion system protein [Escherichia coli]|uniref:VirB3 family type IV secretion system protein n=1 Tax=Escherichia coli TaxID=562 RepID=UPI001C133604|nr:VirB3 family type IV secretion system protein [Escherichia coli]EHO4880165.1 VirB3 family type IV secretion system protein [Escherichia coli]EKM7581782.1 VirB3 family type IV secretion system protein [Escherichia coli]MCM5414804.1 VirB3 family type IV secretion system protein [Escherichia coli]MCX8321020.1 VirB3 family type IV secretion system protein [Escherichia coli]MCX8337424.1 VirB3 family type IV secretion system protein [Escherichia coli]
MGETNEILEFDTNNAMNRVAMFAGIPVFAFLFLVVIGCILTFSSVWMWGWWGFIVTIPFILAIVGLRIICERDDKAFRRFRFQLRRWKMNRKYGRHLLLTSRNPRWRDKYARRVIQKRILTGK